MVTAPASARMATAPMTATRSTWTASIVQRRSSRSARPPATRPNRTIGTWAAIETPAISAGDLVSPTAISGIAISEMPSARFAAAVERPQPPEVRGQPAAEGGQQVTWAARSRRRRRHRVNASGADPVPAVLCSADGTRPCPPRRPDHRRRGWRRSDARPRVRGGGLGRRAPRPRRVRTGSCARDGRRDPVGRRDRDRGRCGPALDGCHRRDGRDHCRRARPGGGPRQRHVGLPRRTAARDRRRELDLDDRGHAERHLPGLPRRRPRHARRRVGPHRELRISLGAGRRRARRRTTRPPRRA